MQVAATLFCRRNVLGFSALKLNMHSKRKLRKPQKRKLNQQNVESSFTSEYTLCQCTILVYYSSVLERGKSSSLHSLELDPIELTIWWHIQVSIQVSISPDIQRISNTCYLARTRQKMYRFCAISLQKQAILGDMWQQ